MAPTDYQTLIDAPTWSFIARTNACYPDDTASRSLAEQRCVYDKMCRVFHRGYPAGITAYDIKIADVPCRVYKGKLPTVVYLHGGGFILGGLGSHDDICAEICARTGYEVVCPDYRLAPEHVHPAAYDDTIAVARALARTGPFLLAGDSAGGGLAASAALALRGTSPPIGAVLIYAGLGGNASQGSYLIHANAPLLSSEDVLFYGNIRHAGAQKPLSDPTASALDETDFSALPPVFAFSAECDPLADDGRDFCARVTAAGGNATWHLEPGLVHGYLRARHTVPRAAQSFDRIINVISALGATT